MNVIAIAELYKLRQLEHTIVDMCVSVPHLTCVIVTRDEVFLARYRDGQYSQIESGRFPYTMEGIQKLAGLKLTFLGSTPDADRDCPEYRYLQALVR